MSTRTDKIASVIHHAVQNVITRGLSDPRIRGLVSITNVEVSADLSEAKVGVSVLPQSFTELTMHGLRDAAGHIQHEVAREVTARRMPRLRFVVDDSLKRQAALDAALRRDEATTEDAPGSAHQDTHETEEGQRT